MIRDIITGVVYTVLAAALIAFVINLWIHLKQPNQMLGGYPGFFLGWIRSKLKRKETEEEKTNREYWEEMGSDDPEKWKPVNLRKKNR